MKAKPVIIILATLLIGFLLGMLTSARIRYHKLNPVRVFFSEERFRDGFYSIIEPTDEQKEKIDVILDKYARINNEIKSNFRKDLDSTMAEFRREVDSCLSEEQIGRLKKMEERRQEMIREHRRAHENDTTGSRRGGHHHPGPEHFPEGDTMMTPPGPAI